MSKPKVVKDYEKIGEEVLKQIKLKYPYGFEKHLVTFKNAKGAFVSALPFEAADRYYLIRMTQAQARNIIEDDDDYNEDGHLKTDVKDEYMENLEISEEDFKQMEKSMDD